MSGVLAETDIWARVFGISGMAVGLAGLAWTLWRDQRDRPRIEVTLTAISAVESGRLMELKQRFGTTITVLLEVLVRNTGASDMGLAGWAFECLSPDARVDTQLPPDAQPIPAVWRVGPHSVFRIETGVTFAVSVDSTPVPVMVTVTDANLRKHSSDVVHISATVVPDWKQVFLKRDDDFDNWLISEGMDRIAAQSQPELPDSAEPHKDADLP